MGKRFSICDMRSVISKQGAAGERSEAHLADRRSQKGFTLIEMLVVISIILLLIGILLPALRHARNTGKAAVCMSNVRQLLTATSVYLNDHKELYPQPNNTNNNILPTGMNTNSAAAKELKGAACWFNALDPYLAQIKRDYDSTAERNYKEFKQDPVWKDAQYPEQARTLKMNEFFAGDPTIGQPVWTDNYKLRKNSEIVVYGDGRGEDCLIGGPLQTPGGYGGDYGLFEMNPRTVGLRHGKGANIGFADEHVEQYQQATVTQTTGSGRMYLAWYREDEDAAKPDEDLQELIWDFHKYQ